MNVCTSCNNSQYLYEIQQCFLPCSSRESYFQMLPKEKPLQLDKFYSWTTTAASGIQDTWDERGKACVSHHFLCVCMCVSSDGCRLRSAWATDFANKVKQIWTTPLKAPHCIFHQRAICRQTEGENDLGTDVFTEGPIMKARFQQTRFCLTASAQFKFSRHPFRFESCTYDGRMACSTTAG